MDSTDSEVVILGHSFVVKLQKYAHSEWENLKLDPSQVKVHFNGIPGGTFTEFRSKDFTKCLKASRIKYAICEIGGNDLDSKFRSETEVARSILSYAEFLHHGFGIEKVAVNQLLFRFKTRHISVPDYNKRVIEVNKAVKLAAKDASWLTYWKHKGLKNSTTYPYNDDGVHLNAFGMTKYVRSVRGAVLSMSGCRG